MRQEYDYGWGVYKDQEGGGWGLFQGIFQYLLEKLRRTMKTLQSW